MEKIDLCCYSKPDKSLGDYVKEKMRDYEMISDLLRLDFVDLNMVENEYEEIRGDLENLKNDIPIDLKLLYSLFLNKLNREYHDDKIKKFLEN